MNLHKKKKGSMLLLLLVMAMIIVVIGGTLSTAAAYTTKTNNSVKGNEDLLYAAESGLEVAVAKLRAREITVPNPPSKYTFTLEDNVFKNYNGINVTVEIKMDNPNYIIESTATKGTATKRVKAKILVTPSFIPGPSNVFRYTLCAEKLDVKCTGPLHSAVTKWNAQDLVNSNVMQNTNVGTGENVTVNMANDAFIIPQFNFEKATSTVVLNGNPSTLDGKDGVVKIKPSDTNTQVTIYLVNADLLHIINPDVLNKTVIITNGKIKVDNGLEGPVGLTLNSSTIFGKSFEFKMSSFNSAWRLIGNDPPNQAFDIIDSNGAIRMDNKIKEYAPNWNGNTGVVGDESLIFGEVEYLN